MTNSTRTVPASPLPPTAVLVAVQLPSVSDEEHAASLAELAQLVKTLGHQVVATLSQKRAGLSKVAVLGRGKLAELAALTGGSGVVPSGAVAPKDKARARRGELDDDSRSPGPPGVGGAAVEFEGRRPGIIAVDHEITPSQARNLERATDAIVLDRTGVIVEIFHRHAKTRQARLEVEVARLNYEAPRLRETGGGKDRQRGGIGQRGSGESALELDRRKIRDRIAELKIELAAIKRDDDLKRCNRGAQQRVALVGYTNAGKSSLMRGLTASEVLVEDKLFATLDTTVRAIQPESKPRILVSDTVGFIKKLPHDLVASFRSTLDEAQDAALLLFVADAADPTFRSQLATTREVLGEIGAGTIPSRLLLNKVDRLNLDQRKELAKEFPEAIQISAKEPSDIAALRNTIVSFFEESMIEAEILVPYAKAQLVGDVHAATRVLSEEYDEFGTRFRVRAYPTEIDRFRRLLN